MKMTDQQKELAETNMKLVSYIAKTKIKPLAQEYDDYIQEGMLGLCIACMRYNPDKGASFSTYASSYIEGFMRTYRRNNTLIKEPRPIQENYHRISLYKSKYGDDCDEAQMLKDLKISPIQYLEMKAKRAYLSIDSPIKDGENIFIADVVPDTRGQDEWNREQEEELLIELEDKLVSKYSQKVRDIYDEYFYNSLFGDKISKKALAEKYKLSKSYVSNLIIRMNKKLLEEYLKCR